MKTAPAPSPQAPLPHGSQNGTPPSPETSQPRSETEEPFTFAAPIPPPRPAQPTPTSPPPDRLPGLRDVLKLPALIDPAEFKASFGEPIDRTLNLDTWTGGIDLTAALDRLEYEVAHALKVEDSLADQTRRLLFPLLEKQGGGIYQARREMLEHTQRTVLFNGAIEAADGLCAVHDTLPLTVAQIGVCLTGYGASHATAPGSDSTNADQSTWGHRLFRRDLRIESGDPIEEALAILEHRDLRADVTRQGRRDLLSHLFRRGILAWAQRTVLLRKSTKPWRMGHGQPAPYELLTGGGSIDLLGASLEVLNGLLLQHKKFIFVPREPSERLLLTIGNALGPSQFAVVETAERRMTALVEGWDLRGPHRDAANQFFHDTAPNIMACVYRTYTHTPPQVFYAHRDHIEEAGLIAIADSLLQSHRNFPALLDLTDNVCQSLFGAESFNSSVQAANSNQGHPLRYVSERQTKR